MADGTYVDDPTRLLLGDGSWFSLFSPDASRLEPETIAHSLAHLCRFTGHVQSFYSVAQHCVIVSELVPPEYALEGLMHDASEALIGDISSPLKYALDRMAPRLLSGLEADMHVVLSRRFGFGWPFPPEVKYADLVAVATELRDLMPNPGAALVNLPTPHADQIIPLGPAAAKRLWLARYAEVTS